MAGIFRYNTNTSTPNRRHTLSPFCTSPGQLQDVTMDQTYGLCTPCTSIQHPGSTSPGQGRSIREFEEQMASLRKENFNLKLRIYFLEEQLPGRSSSNADGHDNLMKQIVDLKVDNEVIRKELHEKQSLLCEAAKAMELMEEQQKAIEERSKEMVEELNQKINYLEMEHKQIERSTNQSQMDQIMGRTEVIGDIDTVQKIRELEGCIKQYSEKTEELNIKINEMEDIITEKNIKIQELEEKLKTLTFQNAELQEQLGNQAKEITNAECSRLREELYGYKLQLADKICIIEELQNELKEKTTANEIACKAIKNLVSNSQELQQQMEKLKLSNSSQMKEDNYGNNSTALCFNDYVETSGAMKGELQDIVEEKNNEITKLNMDIMKNKIKFKNFVNKEIKQKHYQIENLKKLINNFTSPQQSPTTSPLQDIDEMPQSFTEFELNAAIERNRFLRQRIEDHTKQVFQALELKHSNDLKQFDAKINKAVNDAEMSHRWSREAGLILTARLEELAGFLDSLLKQKGVLGALGVDRSKEMRKAIDKSLNLSRNLNNISLNISGMSMSELSFAQLSNTTGLYDISTDKKEDISISETKEASHQQMQFIENLQTEVKVLKRELSNRKVNIETLKRDRRSLPLFLENQSDSEAWSEPDRSVSLARMGLEKTPGLSRSKGSETEQLSTSSDSQLDRRGMSKSREKISKLEKLILDKDSRLRALEYEIKEADHRQKQECNRASQVLEELGKYKKINEILEEELHENRSKVHRFGENLGFEKDNLKRSIDEKDTIINQIQKEREELKIELRIAQQKVETLVKNIEEEKSNHQQNLQRFSENEKARLDQLQKNLLQQEQKLKEQEERHRADLARDWISRVIYEDMKCDWEAVQKKYNEAQCTIKYLQENEAEVNQRLIENEKTERNLQKKLDEATLISSQAILDRTKFLHEKDLIECRIEELTLKLEETEKEKAELEVKVIQLEKSNSELLKRTHLSNNQEFKQPKKPSSHGSDASQSGYTSEDVPMTSKQKGVHRAENSSPDLGIESDAGRASSVELAVATRLLKSIENLEPKENVMEKEPWKLQDKTNDRNERDVTTSSGPIIHDCAKVEQENIELRRKLARTKRAFESAAEKLRTSNKLKEQIERDIRQQILKTHNVLKNVRSNMESELGTKQD